MRHSHRLLVLALSCIIAGGVDTAGAFQGRSDSLALSDWLKAYDRAFNAKDLGSLAAFYHPDVTIYEGGGVNQGWIDYRDNHLGPELQQFQELQFAHSNVQAHLLEGGHAAYVTSEYSLKAKVGDRAVDGAGLETLVLVQDASGAWKIRHSHTSARRRPSSGGDEQR